MLEVQLALSIYIGIGWTALGLWLALVLAWDRPARMAVFSLGLLTGIFRIQQAAHDYRAGFEVSTYLLTTDALILNAFIAAALTVLNVYAIRIVRSRGVGG